MIDYESIVKGLTPDGVENLLRQLGGEVQRKDNCLICTTICHNAYEGSPKLYYYFDTHLFVCYSECGNMSIFSFLKHYYDTRNILYDWHNDILLPALNCSTYTAAERSSLIQPYVSEKDKYKPQKPKELKIYDKRVLDVFTKFYPPEWLNDGITKETMDKFDIRYSISQNKIIIPHYNINGELVGIRGRALNPWEVENVGKYMPVQVEGIWYSHPLSLNPYGLYQNKQKIKRDHICYIYEGEKSVLQQESFNMSNCSVAVCGSHLNKWTMREIIKIGRPDEVVLCFDNEEKPGEDIYFNKLYTMCKKYSKLTNFSFIYDRDGLTEPKDSPTDKGEEIFRELLRRRVKVQ